MVCFILADTYSVGTDKLLMIASVIYAIIAPSVVLVIDWGWKGKKLWQK